jgi:hypothetical protein
MTAKTPSADIEELAGRYARAIENTLASIDNNQDDWESTIERLIDEGAAEVAAQPRWVRDESGIQAWFSNDGEWMIRRGCDHSDNPHGFTLGRRNHDFTGPDWALKWPPLPGSFKKLAEAKAAAESAR